MITNRQIAEAIAAKLFTSGDHKRAARLVLEMPGGMDAGGWSIGPMVDRIEEELARLSLPYPPSSNSVRDRLAEIVSAIRDLNRLSREEWIVRFPKLHALCGRSPLETGMADRPVTRFVENLQCELQLRTAEFLLASNNDESRKL